MANLLTAGELFGSVQIAQYKRLSEFFSRSGSGKEVTLVQFVDYYLKVMNIADGEHAVYVAAALSEAFARHVEFTSRTMLTWDDLSAIMIRFAAEENGDSEFVITRKYTGNSGSPMMRELTHSLASVSRFLAMHAANRSGPESSASPRSDFATSRRITT